jgi:hypothetical protein
MSSTTFTETLSTTSTTYGKLRYVPAGHTPGPISQNFGLPAISDFGDERIMPLHDMRPLPTVDQLPTAKEGTAQLLTHGFTAVKHPSIMHSAPYTYASWHNPELLQKIYVTEIGEMLKQITGAKAILTTTLLLRSSTKSGQDALSANTGHGQINSTKEAQPEATKKAQTPISPPQQGTALPKLDFPQIIGFSPIFGGIPPAPKVHLDFAPVGARTHIRLFHPIVTAAYAPIIAAEDRLLAANLPLDTHYSSSPGAPRWAIYSVWRPLKPIKRDPLALGDVRSFAEEDYVTIDVPAPTMGLEGGRKETHIMKACVSRWREGHRWCYVSEQKPDEVLVIGLWDSDREGYSVGAGGAMHSSVEIEGREGEEPRESLELRCLAMW